jgi:hypothetical protein
MPSKNRKKLKGEPRGKNHGRELSPAQQENIVQTFAVTNNVRETARQCRISEATAHKYIKKAVPSEIMAYRQKAMRELAGKAHKKAVQIIDSITPEDLESGRLPIRDTQGEIVGYRQFGPTLMQKVTSAAILTDKLEVLLRVEEALKEGQSQGELLIPSDVKALVHGIRGRIKRLRVLDVQFEEKNKDLSQRVQDKLEEVEALANAQEADAEVLDFDNPGGFNESDETRVSSNISS